MLWLVTLKGEGEHEKVDNDVWRCTSLGVFNNSLHGRYTRASCKW